MRVGYHRLDEREREKRDEEICRFKEQGYSNENLERRFDLSPSAICAILKKHKVATGG